MKTRLIPLIVMLAGGAVWCAVALLKKVDFRPMLWILLIVLIVFFTIGCIFRFLIEKHLDNVLNPPPEEENDEESGEGEEGEENSEGISEDEESSDENSDASDEGGSGSLFSDEP